MLLLLAHRDLRGSFSTGSEFKRLDQFDADPSAGFDFGFAAFGKKGCGYTHCPTASSEHAQYRPGPAARSHEDYLTAGIGFRREHDFLINPLTLSCVSTGQ